MDATTIGIIITVAMAFAGGYGILAKYIWNQNQREAKEALAAVKADATKQVDELKQHHANAVIELQKTAERLRIDELSTMELKGRLALLEQRHDALTEDISEIKREQVPRAEWEREMKNVNQQLRDILHALSSRGAIPYKPSDSSSRNPVQR